MYVGQMLMMIKQLYLWVRRNNVFINFMWNVLLSCGYNVFYIYSLAITCRWQGAVTWCMTNRKTVTVTMWLKVLNLLCFKPNLHSNSKVLQGVILSALMLGSVLALVQVLSQRGAFWGVKGGVCPITYLGLALDRGWYRALIWHICRMMWGPLNECSYASLCPSICL